MRLVPAREKRNWNCRVQPGRRVLTAPVAMFLRTTYLIGLPEAQGPLAITYTPYENLELSGSRGRCWLAWLQ